MGQSLVAYSVADGAEEWERIVNLVCHSVTSAHTQRAYSRALWGFYEWYETVGRPGLSRAVVQHYRADLVDSGLGAATINQRLSALRKLAQEAAANGFLSADVATGIQQVQGVKQHGQRLGNWLSKEEVEQLLDLPGNAPKHLRNRAILAVLVGCGLRRSEVAGLTLAHVQQRAGRWVVVDLVGKHRRMRSVPMPSWTKATLDAWCERVGLREGCYSRPLDRRGQVVGEQMTAEAVRDVVKQAGARLGRPDLAPYDLRRTFAKLAHRGGAGLDQIQLSLGHASVQTTERYLGVDQDLHDAPCDRLGVRVRGI